MPQVKGSLDSNSRRPNGTSNRLLRSCASVPVFAICSPTALLWQISSAVATTVAMLLETRYVYGCGLFPPHILRLLVVAQRHESAVPQVCIAGPLDIFELP